LTILLLLLIHTFFRTIVYNYLTIHSDLRRLAVFKKFVALLNLEISVESGLSVHSGVLARGEGGQASDIYIKKRKDWVRNFVCFFVNSVVMLVLFTCRQSSP
jgi:hypothetical protein